MDNTKVQESKALVRRQFGKDAGVTEEEKTLDVHQFVTTPAEVSFEVGVTMNLGNYESARITVGLRVPCYKEELSDAYVYARTWAEKIIAEEKAALKSSGGDIF